MTVVATRDLIAPHGGRLVDRTGERPDNLDVLEVVTLTSREVSDLDMIASGALSPLEGFMRRDDYTSVVDELHLSRGLPWSLPVCLAVDAAPRGDVVALADESGRALATLEVDEVYDYDREREAERCFRTTETEHPGVARLFAQTPLYLAGAQLLEVFPVLGAAACFYFVMCFSVDRLGRHVERRLALKGFAGVRA